MTISRKGDSLEFLKSMKLRHGGPVIGPTCDGDYEFVDVISNELPIYYDYEFAKAKEIGEEFGLELTWHGSVLGEGLGPDGKGPKNEPVYSKRCNSLDELKEAPAKISKATTKLEKELDKK